MAPERGFLKASNTGNGPGHGFSGGSGKSSVPGPKAISDQSSGGGPYSPERGPTTTRGPATSHRLNLSELSANPCNTNCLIAMHNAKGVPQDRFSAMTRLDQNRAKAQLALKAGKHWSTVKNVTIWGNHSNTQYPDWHHATVDGIAAAKAVNDDAWLQGPFLKTVQERGKAIIEARGKSSAMSAAQAAVDHAHSLFTVTTASDWASLCVVSDGSYGTPAGIISSFPCTTDGKGNWKIVQGLAMNEFSRQKAQVSWNELVEEREMVKPLLG